MPEELKIAIEGLYTVFKRYPLRTDMPFCTHCHEPGEVQMLVRTPLRELTPKQLGHNAFDAATTFGEVVDYKYLLPRIFELMATDLQDWPGFGPWLQAGKLAYVQWRTWPKDEQVAVERFWRALFRRQLAGDYPALSSDLTPERVLFAMADAGIDFADELRVWYQDKSLRATIWLADAYRNLDDDPARRPSRPADAALFALLLDAEQPLRFQAAFFEARDPKIRQLISDAEEKARALARGNFAG